MTDKQS